MDANSQRRHRRVALHVPVRVSSIDAEADGHGHPCYRATRELCANLSIGGAFIRTEEPIPPGRRILLELELPDGRPLETIGRVAWARTLISPAGHIDSGCGIEFVEPDKGQRKRIEKLLERTALGRL